jgi:anti-sigma factor RsiW
MTASTPSVPPEKEQRLVAYLAGELGPEETSTLEKEILTDDALAELFYSLQGMDAILTPAGPAEVPEPAASSPGRVPFSQRAFEWLRPPRIWVPAAAAVLIAVLLARPAGFFGDGDHTVRMRGSEVAPVALAPMGDLTSPPERFVWRGSPNAARYRFRLLDSSARLVHEAVTSDTTLVVPAAFLRGLATGTWIVVVQDRKGAETQVSQPATFRVKAP